MSLLVSTLTLLLSNFQALLIFLVVFLIAYYYLRQPSNLPPGPRGLPFIGNFLHTFLHTATYKSAEEWHKQHGKIITISRGKRKIIVVSDFPIIKEVIVKYGNYVSGRGDSLIRRHLAKNGGVLFNEGPAWKEQRRFALMSLRDFGMGKLSLEGRIQEETSMFIEELNKLNGQPTDLQVLTANVISNVICSIVFGKRFEYDDQEFNKNINDLNAFFRTVSTASLANDVPILKYVPTRIKNEYQVFQHGIQSVVEWVQKKLDDHRAAFDPDKIEDFIDAYLGAAQHLQRNEAKKTSLTDQNMISIIFDLFIAGTETTSTTLRWAMLLMSLNPDIQRKVQEEIDSVVPRERLPSLHERPLLVYTEAVMCEVLRWGTILPFAVTHKITDTFSYQGYTFPAGMGLMYNVWSVHRDPDFWTDPEVFKPERFIAPDGTMDKSKTERLIPFGVGRRQCLGEALARMEFFLFFSALMQNFTFKRAENDGMPDLETYSCPGLYRPPDGHQLHVLKRNSNIVE